MRKCIVIVWICLCWLGSAMAQSGGLPCANSQAFCTGSTTFPAITGGGTAPAGPNYGCLFQQPNPSWFYLQVGQAGTISMNISGASPNDDIDFAAWGPFSSLASGCSQLTAACAQCPNNTTNPNFYPSGNMVDCSYSSLSFENCTIPNAQVGQVYIILITNFGGTNTNITFSQTNANQPGAGATDCNILMGTPSACNPNTNLYSLSGTYLFGATTPGTSTSLTITNSCSGTVLTYTPPFTSPMAFSFNNLSSNGAPCTMTATFSNGTTKTFSYTAPAQCATNTVAVAGTTVCPGHSAVLTPTTDLSSPSFTWNPGGTVAPSITVTPNTSTVYTVLASGTNTIINAPSTASITVTVGVYVTFTPTVMTNAPVCQGSTITNTVWPGLATNYSWAGPNGFSSSGPSYTMSIANAQPSASGVYTVTNTYPSGCTSSSTVNLVVTSTPSVQASNNSTICQGNSLALVGNDFGGGAIAWLWAGPTATTTNTTQNVIINNAQPAVSGIYTLTATYNGGCTAHDTTLVTITPLPVPVLGSNSPVCFNNPINLTASGATNYQWTGPNGFASGSATPSIANASPGDAGVYTVTLTTSNCSSVDSISVIVYPALNVTVSNSVTICAGDVTVLSATGSGGNGNLSYSWQPGTGLFSTYSGTVNANPGTTTDYTVTLSDNCNTPTVSAVVTVSVNPLPVINFGASRLAGCAPVCTSFTMSSVPAAAASTWSLGPVMSNTLGSQFSYCFNDAGSFDVGVTVTDINGCVSSSTIFDYITVYANPVADFQWNPSEPTILNNLVQFSDETAHGSGPLSSWAWTFGDPDNSISSHQNPSMTYLDIGNYEVRLIVIDDNGCTDTVTKYVLVKDDYVLFIPNAFTPNDDNLNDQFSVKGTGFDLRNFEMLIYDRWGNLIYRSEDASKGWDGKIKGSDPAPADIYAYKIRVVNLRGEKKEYVGHITLIR